MSDEMLQLVAATGPNGFGVNVDVDLAAGARIRQVTISDGVDAVELLAPDADHDRWSTGWGSFPMAPWAGRLRNGRFRFLDREIGLDLNHSDRRADGTRTGGGPIHPPRPAPVGPLGEDDLRRHAIHGTTFARRWETTHVEADRVEAICRLEGTLGWEFAGIARQRITVSSTQLDLDLSVEPDDGTIFPASLGWHPWFAKPDRLVVYPIAMFEKDRFGLPTGHLVAPTEPPWDDCFVIHEPVELHYERPIAPVVTVASPDCDHWVIYDMPTHATCVEPQSGPPDALTLRPELATSARPLRRTMTIGW